MIPHLVEPDKLSLRDRLLVVATAIRNKDYGITELIKMMWGEDCPIDRHQADIIYHILRGWDSQINEIAIKGCTGAGKGGAVAIAINIWFELSPTCKIILTSSSYDHVKSVLFAEVLKWREKLLFEPTGETMQSEIRESEQKRIICLNPKLTESFSGHHGRYTLFIFDEASCFDDQTEVLTRRGWQPWAEVNETDDLLTMSQETRVAYWQRPAALYRTQYNGPMYFVDRKGLNFAVTPRHRMWCERHRKDDDDLSCWKLEEIRHLPNAGVRMDSHVKYVAPDKGDFFLREFVGKRKTWPERRIEADAWLRFLGWFLSEGHVNYVDGIPYSTVITQSAGPRQREIEAAIAGIGFPVPEWYGATTPQIAIHSGQLAAYLAQECGRGAANKRMSRFVSGCSPRQMRLFLEEYCKGDGHKRQGQERDILYTSSNDLATGLHEIAVLAGYRSSMRSRRMAGRETKFPDGHIARTEHDGWSVTLLHRHDKKIWLNVQNDCEVNHYDGEIFCAWIPPDELLYVRRQGYAMWTGNSVASDFYDIAQTQACLRVSLSNPRTLSGWFKRLFDVADDPDVTGNYKLTDGGTRRLITVSGLDCRNVREGQVVLPGQITKERLAGIMAHPNPEWGRVFGEGRFPSEDIERQVILPSWLKRHARVWTKEVPVECFGLDIADSEDGDATALAAGSEAGCRRVHTRDKQGAMQTVGWVFRVAEKYYGIDLRTGQYPVCVDSDGLGKPMADRLHEQGVWVINFHGNAPPNEKELYQNLRAETYALLAQRLDPQGPWAHTPWPIPRDGQLHEDLTAQEKIFSSEGFKFKLMPKITRDGSESIRKKLGRSPDRGDSVMMLYGAIVGLRDDEEVIRDGEMIIAGPGEKGLDDKEIKKRLKEGTISDPFIESILGMYDRREEWDDPDQMDRRWDQSGQSGFD